MLAGVVVEVSMPTLLLLPPLSLPPLLVVVVVALAEDAAEKVVLLLGLLLAVTLMAKFCCIWKWTLLAVQPAQEESSPLRSFKWNLYDKSSSPTLMEFHNRNV